MKALRKFKDKCIYPDWEGGFITGEHRFDKVDIVLFVEVIFMILMNN